METAGKILRNTKHQVVARFGDIQANRGVTLPISRRCRYDFCAQGKGPAKLTGNLRSPGIFTFTPKEPVPMKMRKMAAVSAMTIAAMGLAAGTVYADPAPAPAANGDLNVQVAPAINYKAYQNGTAAVFTTDAGSLTVANGQLQVKDNAGIVVGGLPLLMQLDDMQVPIAAQVDGRTATLTLDAANAVYNPVALPFQEGAPWKTPYDREVAAWTRMTQTVALGVAIGAIVGAIGAGIIGCPLGALAVGAGAAFASFAFLGFLGVPGAVIGCLGGAVAFAPVGALVGSIFIGAPVAIAAAIQYFTTINEPFPPPKPAG